MTSYNYGFKLSFHVFFVGKFFSMLFTIYGSFKEGHILMKYADTNNAQLLIKFTLKYKYK